MSAAMFFRLESTPPTACRSGVLYKLSARWRCDHLHVVLHLVLPGIVGDPLDVLAGGAGLAAGAGTLLAWGAGRVEELGGLEEPDMRFTGAMQEI